MIELFKKLNDRATDIVNIRVADVIDDIDLLTVALCAGNLDEIACTLCRTRGGDHGYEAAHRALDLGWNPSLREEKVKEGYFAKGLRGLIEVAKKNQDAGSRLMPVFCEMVSNCKKYGISKKLKRETVCYMEHMRNRDGFAIVCIDDGAAKVVVKPADGLFDN